MEEWQREYITSNLHELASNTIFNGELQAQLRYKRVLCKAEVAKLNAEIKQNGNLDASYHCYEWLMTRKNAYEALAQALIQNSQTDAARILIEGVPTELFSKPLTYLGIPTLLENFKDADLEVHGKTYKVHEFFPGVNYQNLQKIFEDTVCELEIYDTFITKQRNFVLANNTIPPKPPIYLPRFVSNRIEIDKPCFKSKCSDVFVFKTSIERLELSRIAKLRFIDPSSSQLTKIEWRFIYLEENEHWTELKKKCLNVPIHLINYEADQDHFVLEDSSDSSDIVKRLASKKERAYMAEEDFLKLQLSQDNSSSCVYICDRPGMGKTYLLGNIAHRMTETCTGRITVFIQLTTFVKDWFPDATSISLEPEAYLLNVISYICPSHQNPELLFNLVKTELLQVDIFLDGFDELPTDKVDWMKQVLQLIITSFSNVKIYITSKPHMRKELEQTLGVVSYDILPFNQENQVDFLVQFWQNKSLSFDQLSLQTFPTICLEALNKSLTKTDKEIAGNPLLCQLIAEVCSDKEALNSIKPSKLYDVPLRTSEVHGKFIENKIKLVSNNEREFDEVKLVHIWHALKLIFPEEDFHEEIQFENIENFLTSPAILNAGILHKQSKDSLEFIHRTFAEYLAAEYLSCKIQSNGNSTSEQKNTSTFNLLLQCHRSMHEDYIFLHHVIVQFFNSLLGDDDFSEELKIQISKIVSLLTNDQVITIMCACCKHNLLNIFRLLSGALSKCENSRILEFFTDDKNFELLRVCIEISTCRMFHACIQLLTAVLKVDVVHINKFNKEGTLVQLAVREANLEAVEYFLDKVSLKNQKLLTECVTGYWNSVEKRKAILNFLLNKDRTLIHETPDILYTLELDVGLFKILVSFGARLTALAEYGDNCAMYAANYMSPSDYHELVEFLLTECKAEYLFLVNHTWKDPLRSIIEEVAILPETMELLLKIPGMDIRVRERWEESLLFHAVQEDDLNRLKQLVERGVDYKATNYWNKSLLQAAVEEGGGAEMVRYLLSLKLDLHSRDESGGYWTPLHYAARDGRLDVVKALVENGANVKAEEYEGKTALHYSVEYCYGEFIKVIKYLIKMGADVNARDNNDDTPLHLCEKRKEVKELLIEMGADIHAKNLGGNTPAEENPDLWK